MQDRRQVCFIPYGGGLRCIFHHTYHCFNNYDHTIRQDQVCVRAPGRGISSLLGQDARYRGWTFSPGSNQPPVQGPFHRQYRLQGLGLASSPIHDKLWCSWDLKGKCALGPFLSILVIECQHKCLNVNLCPWMDKVQIKSKGMFLSLSTLILKNNVLCLSAGNRRNRFREKLAVYSQKAVSVWSTGLSGGAPDSVRCARLACAKWPLLGIHRRRTAIIHRTVRCAPDCPVCQRSAGPTVGRGIRVRHVAEPTVGRGHRTVRCAPDCPVCTRHVRCANGSKAANGRLRHLRKEIGHRTLSGVHRTVQCARRQKARMAFQICSQRLLAALGL
jgi:hypothetical protein